MYVHMGKEHECKSEICKNNNECVPIYAIVFSFLSSQYISYLYLFKGVGSLSYSFSSQLSILIPIIITPCLYVCHPYAALLAKYSNLPYIFTKCTYFLFLSLNGYQWVVDEYHMCDI